MKQATITTPSFGIQNNLSVENQISVFLLTLFCDTKTLIQSELLNGGKATTEQIYTMVKTEINTKEQYYEHHSLGSKHEN